MRWQGGAARGPTLARMRHAEKMSPLASEITRRNVRTVRELEALAMAQPSVADRIAAFVARFAGSRTTPCACANAARSSTCR